ncbi:MAG: ATP-binding cassette domain-containing protein [Candidatus Kaelpia imicola]|nr:ATP-binding cassette domain-containing protein [Candidatus Kaelpia imicola]
MKKILEVNSLSKKFKVGGAFLKKRGEVAALSDVSFKLDSKETVGVIGESGSGKSTLAFVLAGLYEQDQGSILFKGKDLSVLYKKDLRVRREIQIVFQDPYNTLNPRYTVFNTLREPLLVHNIVPRKKIRDEVLRTLDIVGLRSDYLLKYPHELSGGERQRIAIARAIILKPELLICDEPTSNLDLSIQAQILNLLLKIKDEEGLSVIFITHDIKIASFISDRIIVLYDGSIIEEGKSDDILDNPQKDYTKTLLKASAL